MQVGIFTTHGHLCCMPKGECRQQLGRSKFRNYNQYTLQFDQDRVSSYPCTLFPTLSNNATSLVGFVIGKFPELFTTKELTFIQYKSFICHYGWLQVFFVSHIVKQCNKPCRVCYRQISRIIYHKEINVYSVQVIHLSLWVTIYEATNTVLSLLEVNAAYQRD